MTLTTRLTLFSLAALAVVLAGFFGRSCYTLARNLVPARPTTGSPPSSAVLTAAAEVEAGRGRVGARGARVYRPAPAGTGWSWVVTDAGRAARGSDRARGVRHLLAEAAGNTARPGTHSGMEEWSAGPGGPWLVRQDRLRARAGTPAVGKEGDGDQAGEKYPALVVTVGASLRNPFGRPSGNWRRSSSAVSARGVGGRPRPAAGPSAGGRCGRSPGWRTAARGMDRRRPRPAAPGPPDRGRAGRPRAGVQRPARAGSRRRSSGSGGSPPRRPTSSARPLAALLGQVEVALRAGPGRGRVPAGAGGRPRPGRPAAAGRGGAPVPGPGGRRRRAARPGAGGSWGVAAGTRPRGLGRPPAARGPPASRPTPASADVHPVLLGELARRAGGQRLQVQPAGDADRGPGRAGRGRRSRCRSRTPGAGSSAGGRGPAVRAVRPVGRGPPAGGGRGRAWGWPWPGGSRPPTAGRSRPTSLPGRGSRFVVRVPASV